VQQARQALGNSWRRFVGGLALAGILAVVVVFLIIPATATGTKTACTGSPKLDFFTPKRGQYGDTVEIHGSKLGQVDEVWFKAKGGWAEQDFELVNGVIYTTVPDANADGGENVGPAIDGPLAIVTASGCPRISSVQSFNVFPY
jgi:hypothetical protein